MRRWVEGAPPLLRLPLAAVPPGTLRRLALPPFDVCVANVDGRIHAIEDACPHSGASLAEGRIEDGCVVCPGHGWAIDLERGEVRTPAGRGACTPVYDVTVVDDEIQIDRRR